MRFNRGKRIFSATADGLVLEVRERGSLRWLSFDNSVNVQTAIDIKQPARLILDYLPRLAAISYFQPTVDRVLLLGLGGGALVHHFNQTLPQVDITVVEHSSLVLEVAKQFFMLPSGPHLNYLTEDAASYLSNSEQKFDWIIQDIYAANDLPACAYQAPFYQALHQRLSEDGVAAFNLYCPIDAKFYLLMNIIRQQFSGRTLCIGVPGFTNRVVFAFNRFDSNEQISKLYQSGRLTSLQLDVELGMLADLKL